MSQHAEKTPEKQNRSHLSDQQEGIATAQFTSNRAEAIAQRNLQTAADQSPRHQPLRQLKAIAANNRPVIQRARLNIRTNGTGTISGVSQFPSRPASNLRGTQGQHLTAYVVFKDTILSRVKDRTVPEAAAELIAVLGEIGQLPGMQQQNVGHITAAIAVNVGLLTANGDDAAVVGSVIDNILSIRNQVPGTAIRGEGAGHDEAGSSGRLETVETALRTDSWNEAWDEDVVSDQCRYLVWRLLDYDPPDPNSPAEQAAIAKVVITHFKSIVSAYPLTNDWLNEREDYFTSYLLAHRDDAGIPMKRVHPTDMTAIIALVGAGM